MSVLCARLFAMLDLFVLFSAFCQCITTSQSVYPLLCTQELQHMYTNNELSDASRSCLDTCPSDSAVPGKTSCPEIGRRAFWRGRAESTCFRMIKWAKQRPREAQSASPRPRKTSSTGVSASEEHKEERRRVLESPAGKPNFFTSHTHGDHQTILMGLNVDVSRVRSDPTCACD